MASPPLRSTRTHDALRAAYARDAQSARLYAELSRVALIEGYPAVSRTLTELAETQAMLAGGHLDFLRQVGEPLGDRRVDGTEELIRALKALLSEDLSETLPDAISSAHAEGFFDIASWFESVARTRRQHLSRLETCGEGLTTEGGE